MDEPEPERKVNGMKSIFEEEIKKIQDEIDIFKSGSPNHIAIISEPYSRVEHIYNRILGDNSQKINNIQIFNPVKDTDFFSNFYSNQDIIMMQNCQYLFSRKCCGFAILEEFLDILFSSNKMYITGWNKFAWNYLKEISNIESMFQVIITVPELNSKTIMNLIMSDVSDKVTFIDDRVSEDKKFICFEECLIRMPLSNKEVNISEIKFNFNALKRKKNNKTMEDIQKEAFMDITTLAGGKYDVARKIWKKSLKDGEVRLSRIPQPSEVEISDIDELFILGNILAMDGIDFDELSSIVKNDSLLKQKLYNLVNKGLIEDSDRFYKIYPEAVNSVIDELEKNRMVW